MALVLTPVPFALNFWSHQLNPPPWQQAPVEKAHKGTNNAHADSEGHYYACEGDLEMHLDAPYMRA